MIVSYAQARSICRSVTVLVTLLAQHPVRGQAPNWQAGVAKIAVRADLNRQPGTAFVVAVEDGKAFLVTSAHVVEGDHNPQVEFVSAPRKQYKSSVRHVEGGETHGLALLEVSNAPGSARALEPSASRPIIGQKVTAAGFPASFGNFTAIETTVATFRGRELVIGFETGEGFSGGPIVSENGVVVGLLFGRAPGFGLAVHSAEVRTYLEGQGLSWGSQRQSAAESVKPVPSAERKPGEVRRNPDDGQNYVWIPPGTFLMGCSAGDHECRDNEKPPHMVTITRGFWLGQTEVTQAAYEKVTGINPSHFKSPDRPVEQVTWAEARSYCVDASGRLPTEAEWEYAVRAGVSAARYGELNAIAWYAGNSGAQPLLQRLWEKLGPREIDNILQRNGNQTHKVGDRAPNSWGLYDMLGNVWEMVADRYSPDYYQGIPSGTVDPKGPATPSLPPVMRGGSWALDSNFIRASLRGVAVLSPGGDDDVGFRCVREIIP